MTTITESKEYGLGQLTKFEYLDHTADIMFHTWGTNINEAFEQQVLAMMNYMVELNTVELTDDVESKELTVSGHDLDSLLFSFMDECLFIFNTEFLIFKEIKITNFDKENHSITASYKGIELDKSKHTTGTEIKAITYSCMKIEETKDITNIYVIVDI
ncbi:hypothetical protein DLAC_10323 [Tieghemostelium lacteum]|uniref:Protein archease-like n=1 Tax=Tieghemostelium lacteum TaxID=361077 RepID=A0A151Z553_TIELA|nr:hypothetical protein DLAC_10323 [Tieghemostelium lacteum]|eukprot:KYQ89092.1 hypothetical protein DLAC_10323 [Tieghemostelium lacteum]